MRFALVTLHDANYQGLANTTWDNNKLLYAHRYNYDAIAKNDNFNYNHPFLGFEKIKLLIEIMDKKEHDALFWCGTDTSITNFHIPLNEFLYEGYDVTIASDFNFIFNTDVFLIRNTQRARDWLQMIMDSMPVCHPIWFEQGLMIDSYENNKDMIKIVPQRYLNAYPNITFKVNRAPTTLDFLGYSGLWRPGDFLMHSPGLPLQDKINVHQSIISLIYK